jgi:hypothetical protein
MKDELHRLQTPVRVDVNRRSEGSDSKSSTGPAVIALKFDINTPW